MATVRYGDFEWDDSKARSNAIKHGVSFVEASTVFSDPQAVDAPDRYEPDRFVIIGMSSSARVLFVVHAERGDRIASSAPARRPASSGGSMKKVSEKKQRKPPETSLERYDWTRARRGHYADRFPRTAHAVVIDPELYAQYGSADAINSALALLLRLRASLDALPKPKRARRKAA